MARVLAHAHSRWSYDGKLTLEQWPELARQSGYDAVLFAEHEETGWTAGRYQEYAAACARASTGGVALIPGVEFNQDGYHVIAYGLQRWPARPSSIRELAAAVHEQGCFLCLAHPPRYRWSHPGDLIARVDAVEAWNSFWCCDGTLGPHPRSLRLAEGKPILVGQDVHKAAHVTNVAMVTETDDVLADLKAGRYMICRGRRTWTPEQLRRAGVAAALQRVRTPLLRSALRSYRWVRRMRPRTRRKTLAGEAQSRHLRAAGERFQP